MIEKLNYRSYKQGIFNVPWLIVLFSHNTISYIF